MNKHEIILAAGLICTLIGIAGIEGAIKTGTGLKMSIVITLIGLLCLYFGIRRERREESEKDQKDIGGDTGCRDDDWPDKHYIRSGTGCCTGATGNGDIDRRTGRRTLQ